MIERKITSELLSLLNEYPAVTLLGPRQSGKTTLVRHFLPSFNYRNLEIPDVRAFAEDDPRGFLKEAGRPLILDEIQRVPELLSYVQSICDEQNDNGQYVLTGSHQLALGQAITQSLAGRTAILNLLPLSIGELDQDGISFRQSSDYLWHGFLPRVHDQNQRPAIAYANYFQTYVERDVRQLVQLRDATLFEKFLRLLAGRVGQVINMQSLGNDVGVDSKTIRSWLAVLEASFIVFQLPPYFENVGKRVIKSSKYYFYEPGLLTYLLGINDPGQIPRDPLVGSMFENMIVVEVKKYFTHSGKRAPLYFFRDNHGFEIDLLFKHKAKQVGVEIKAAETLHSKFTKSLEKFDNKLMSLDVKGLVYSGQQARAWSSGVSAVPFQQLGDFLDGV